MERWSYRHKQTSVQEQLLLEAQSHLKCRCAHAGGSEKSSNRDASTHHSVRADTRPARSPWPQQPLCISAAFPATDLQDSSDLVFGVFRSKVDACVLVLLSAELERWGDSEAKMPSCVEDWGGRAKKVNVGFLQTVGWVWEHRQCHWTAGQRG